MEKVLSQLYCIALILVKIFSLPARDGMGNCLRSSSNVENNSNPLKVTNITGIPLLASTSTYTIRSTPSNLTVLFSERSGNENLPTPRSESEILSSSNMKVFKFKELRNATRNFRSDSLIGQGGFGMVYKCWIDEHTFAPSKPGTGMAVAVKKFTSGHCQGYDHGRKQWLSEINYLGQLHHPNLVELIGYCSEGDNLLLVYKFMRNGSLDNCLFRRAQPLSWDIRLKIAIGAAKGVSYLHDAEAQVICGDIKTSNILLDSDFNCKLSDFGMAKAIPVGDKSHESSEIAGTSGYIAPEYMITGHFSAKVDVYSFGVVLLELLSGRGVLCMSEKSEIETNLVDWAKRLANEGNLLQIMDNKLEAQYPKKGAHSMVTLALQCVNMEPTLRPRMSEVLEALEQIRDHKNEQVNASQPHDR